MCSLARHASLVAATAALAALLAVAASSQDVLREWHHDVPFARFGASVADAGDVDGDGVSDQVIGAPGDRRLRIAGEVLVFSGATGAELHRWSASDPTSSMGHAVAGRGRVDGDPFADLALGTPYDDAGGSDAGSVSVFSTEAGTFLPPLRGSRAGDLYGYAVVNAGDLTGDGRPEWLIGAPQLGDPANLGTGYAQLISGDAQQTVLMTWSGDAVGDAFGAALAAGDVDGDRIPDLLVGAPLHDHFSTDGGRLRIFSGADGSVISTDDGGHTEGWYASALAVGHDYNGDGTRDVLVGSPGAHSSYRRSGRVDLFSPIDRSWSIAWGGGHAGGMLGWSVGIAGDTNGDGALELVLGRRVVLRGPVAGQLSLLSTGDTSFEYQFVGARDGDEFGRAFAGVGDLDGDGLDEVLIGAAGSDQAAPNAGSARIVRGAELYLNAEPKEVQTGDSLVLNLGGGAIRAPYVLAVTAVDATPFFRVVVRDRLGYWGSHWIWIRSVPNLAGLEITLKGWTIKPDGAVGASRGETVSFR